jgi:hypothetical protein
MPAIELLTGFVTAPSTTFTALTMASGNSLTIRNTAVDALILLAQAWAVNQTAGNLRIRSPQLHDNVQGLRLRVNASEGDPLLPKRPFQVLQTQDTLVAELTGSATAGDIEQASMLIYYESLPGIEARLITPDELRDRIVNLVTVENSLALGTAGGYSGEEALNAEFDLLRANTDYAIIGYHVSAQCCCVRWRGIDFGNLGVGGPGNELDAELTRSWFVDLAMNLDRAAIPVFNSANVAGVLVDGAQDEDGVDTVLTTILAELSG